MLDLETPRCSLAEGARAAGLPPNTVRTYYDRGVFTLNANEVRASDARAHGISLRRVYQFAITGDLVKLGVAPRTAALWAMGFTDVPGAYIPGRGKEVVRDMGRLCGGAYTWLVGHAGSDASKIFAVTADSTALAVLDFTKHGAVVLPLDVIIGRVNVALKLPND